MIAAVIREIQRILPGYSFLHIKKMNRQIGGRESPVFKLCHRNMDLGVVSNPSIDEPWVYADFKPNANAQKFRSFFNAYTDDEGQLPEPGGDFPNEYFDESLWMLIDPNGERIPISLPAVHWCNSDITWRWRDS